MDEIEKYRERIERRCSHRRRRGRYQEGGRRGEDYKNPPMFKWVDVWFLIILVISGVIMLLLNGCTFIKKTFRGE